MAIREKFEGDMRNLKKRLQGLGKMTLEMIDAAYDCLKNNNREKSQEVIDMDMLINDLQEKIYDNGIILVTKQQPVAVDLRRIIVAMNNASEIERIADFATNICKSILRSSGPFTFVDMEHMASMVEKCKQMITLSISSYEKEDDVLAKQVIELDEEINQLEIDFITQLMKMYGNPEVEPFDLIQIILIVRYLERIGDHATNIAENTVYLVEGSHFHLEI